MPKLAWDESEYLDLEPGDLNPTPAPTDAQRIRVAASLATLIRDRNMRGERGVDDANAETIRAILTMDPEAWARDIGSVRRTVALAYDVVDPKVRFEQTVAAHDRRRRN